MANNERMSADVAELRKWKEDTEAELEQVRAVLDRVSKVCSELDPTDVPYGWLRSLGEAIGQEYLNMCDAFRVCTKLTEEVISLIGQGIANVGELIASFAKKFHL